jgi:hypothetical protein
LSDSLTQFPDSAMPLAKTEQARRLKALSLFEIYFTL